MSHHMTFYTTIIIQNKKHLHFGWGFESPCIARTLKSTQINKSATFLCALIWNYEKVIFLFQDGILNLTKEVMNSYGPNGPSDKVMEYLIYKHKRIHNNTKRPINQAVRTFMGAYLGEANLSDITVFVLRNYTGLLPVREVREFRFGSGKVREKWEKGKKSGKNEILCVKIFFLIPWKTKSATKSVNCHHVKLF